MTDLSLNSLCKFKDCGFGCDVADIEFHLARQRIQWLLDINSDHFDAALAQHLTHSATNTGACASDNDKFSRPVVLGYNAIVSSLSGQVVAHASDDREQEQDSRDTDAPCSVLSLEEPTDETRINRGAGLLDKEGESAGRDQRV